MEERLIQSSSFSIRSPNSISELDDFGQLTFSELQILHQRGGSLPGPCVLPTLGEN